MSIYIFYISLLNILYFVRASRLKYIRKVFTFAFHLNEKHIETRLCVAFCSVFNKYAKQGIHNLKDT